MLRIELNKAKNEIKSRITLNESKQRDKSNKSNPKRNDNNIFYIKGEYIPETTSNYSEDKLVNFKEYKAKNDSKKYQADDDYKLPTFRNSSSNKGENLLVEQKESKYKVFKLK